LDELAAGGVDVEGYVVDEGAVRVVGDAFEELRREINSAREGNGSDACLQVRRMLLSGSEAHCVIHSEWFCVYM
jgi:hypothetical protein